MVLFPMATGWVTWRTGFVLFFFFLNAMCLYPISPKKVGMVPKSAFRYRSKTLCFYIHNLAVCSENLTTFPFSFSPISFTQPQSMDSMCISARNNIATLPKNHVRPKSEIPDHNAHRGFKVFKFNLVPVWEVCLRTVFWFLEQKNTKNMFGKECCFCCPCFPCSLLKKNQPWTRDY